jgi:outer membrane protein assembly factor BamA
LLKIFNDKYHLAGLPYFYRFTSQAYLQMKFSRFFLLIISVLVIKTFAAAQSDSEHYKIVADTTLEDSVPSNLFIASISIYGNKKTKSFIINREIPFKQGDYITPEQLSKELVLAKQQLINTSLFLDVSVYVENRYGQYVFITVFVKERWYIFPLPYFKYIDPNFNAWWVTYNHSLKRTNYGVKFLHNNISGRNDKFTTWLITGYSKQVAVKYERPYFDKRLKNGYSMYISYSDQRELNYGTDISKQQFFRPDSLFSVRKAIKAEVNYIYRPGLRFRHIFKLGYMREDIADTIFALNKSYFADGKRKESFPYFGYTLRYSNADYNIYPTKGFLSEASILHRGFSASMNLTQLQVISTYTVPVLPKTQIQFKEGAIANLPFKQPFYNKNMFGYGGIFMHGYEYYVVDGDVGVVGRATLQHQIFSITKTVGQDAKKQMDIPFRFFAKLYGDAGYAYDKNPGNSVLNNKLLHSWGLGIDMVTAYDLVFKFEYSFNQLGGSGLFLHIATDF